MSDTTPDTAALRARRWPGADAARRTVLITEAERDALCDGYDEAVRLRAEADMWDALTAQALAAERAAARQALADLIGELRGAIDPAILDPYDPDLFQCVHCEQYRDVNDGTDSVAGMACHDCAGRP